LITGVKENLNDVEISGGLFGWCLI